MSYRNLLHKALGAPEGEAEYEIPEWLAELLEDDGEVTKAAGHKYIRREPTGNPKRPWRYFYKVQHGGGASGAFDIKEGSAFKVSHNGKEGHFHVIKVEGDQVTIRHDESGHEGKVSKEALRAMFAKEHAGAIESHRDKLKRELSAAEKTGTPKQRERLAKEAAAAGVAPEQETRDDHHKLAEEESSFTKDRVYIDRSRPVTEAYVQALRQEMESMAPGPKVKKPIYLYDNRDALLNTNYSDVQALFMRLSSAARGDPRALKMVAEMRKIKKPPIDEKALAKERANSFVFDPKKHAKVTARQRDWSRSGGGPEVHRIFMEPGKSSFTWGKDADLVIGSWARRGLQDHQREAKEEAIVPAGTLVVSFTKDFRNGQAMGKAKVSAGVVAPGPNGDLRVQWGLETKRNNDGALMVQKPDGSWVSAGLDGDNE
jgi:hypothetical protein